MNTFRDFEEGQEFQHWPGKTILESDNNLFCLLTVNHHPVHSDIVYASHEKHKKILVVGTYVFSLCVGMSVNDISLGAVANLEYHNIIHLAPCFIGDTISARSLISNKSLTKNNKYGLLSVETLGQNQHGEQVISFQRKIMFNI